MIWLVAKIWRVLPYQVRLKLIRLSQPKFTVSVVAIVLNTNNEILILDHFIRPGTSWGLPGGFIETGESPDQAIFRELKEETGLDLSMPELLRIRTVRKHIEMLYFGRADGPVKLKTSEIRDFGWFEKSSLPDGISDLQRRLIKETFDAKAI